MNCTSQSEICGICREELESSIRILPCKHSFHSTCIEPWVLRVNTCPFCRVQITVPKSVLELARLGVFNTVTELFDRIIGDGIMVDDLVSLHKETYLSSSNVYTVIMDSDNLCASDMVRLFNEECLLEPELFKLCKNDWVEKDLVIEFILNKTICNKNNIRDLIDMFDFDPEIIFDFVDNNIIHKEYVRHILYEKIERLCSALTIDYKYENCPYPVQSELPVLKDFIKNLPKTCRHDISEYITYLE